MPPSSNHQYAARGFPGQHAKGFTGNKNPNFVLAKICPTGELTKYERSVKEWCEKEKVLIAKARQFIRDQVLMKGDMLRVETYACFPGTALWTQKSAPKKMDGTNRLKALHDCMAEHLQVDDSWFWNSTVEKLETTKPEPWVFMVLKPWKPRPVSEIKLEDL